MVDVISLSELFISPHVTVGLQLLTALSLGMLLGAERTLAHKTAGLRTYGLVSMGSALFIIAAGSAAVGISGETNVDMMRVVAGIISGVGFIGAGMIIFRDGAGTVTGLTTAAGLWVAAGIGIAVGFQQYVLALIATVFTLCVFTLFWYIEHSLLERSNITSSETFEAEE